LDGDDILVDLPNGKPGSTSEKNGDTRTNPDFFPRIHGFKALALCFE
jgi:hypothetical protein